MAGRHRREEQPDWATGWTRLLPVVPINRLVRPFVLEQQPNRARPADRSVEEFGYWLATGHWPR